MISIAINKELHSSDGEMDLQVSLELEPGSFIALYGDSGAGKTSLLRMLSGLMKPDSGTIKNGEVTWFDSSAKINIPVQKRKVGFVFQDYALFPNMTVRENLQFAQGTRNNKIIDHTIEVMDLAALQKKNPDELSGGQKQRVALARAIVQEPELLLLDEPLSALDRAMQVRLQEYILKVQQEFAITTFFVTHDVTQIIQMADLVILLKKGKVEKSGKPTTVFGQTYLSGKFQLSGRIIDIYEEDVITIASVLIGKDVIKVVVTGDDDFSIGDEVLVASKAFNPIVKKINS